jgi:two-component system nitrogen regulation sensor histidine kinase NtrY
MLRNRFRSDRLLFTIVGLSFVLTVVLYYVIQRGKLGDTRLAGDKTLLSGLAAALVLLALAVAALIVRNVARVLAGRRSGILGARLQARVFFAFFFLVLIPSLTLFAGAIAIVLRSLSDLIPPDIAKTMDQAAGIAQMAQRESSADARHFARVVADDLARGPLARDPAAARGEIARTLDELRRRYGLTAVGVAFPSGSPVAVAEIVRGGTATALPTELTRVPEAIVRETFASGKGGLTSDRLVYGWRTVATEAVRVRGETVAVAWAAVYIPEDDARRIDSVLLSGREVEDYGTRRPVVQRLYVALFALLTLLVLFAAVWTSFYVAGQITNPILALARGTEALAGGDLTYRVPGSGGDEIGQLVSSFNRMAGEIQRQRREIEGRRRYIETILEAIPVGVLSLDADARVATANRAALELLRLSDLPRGAPVTEALSGGREAVYRVVQPVLEGWARRSSREVPVEVEGKQAMVEATAARFGIPGRGEGVLVVLEDLTPLRRAERLAAWGEVARRLAHEFKNPLTPIRLSAERLLRRYRRSPEEAGEVLEEMVGNIVREVDSLKGLVDEFSRFARLPELRPEPGDVGKVAEEALALYRTSHPQIRYETEFADDLPPHAVDTEAMRRALINLLDNAVALLGPGGEIAVRTRRQPGQWPVVLEVADNGPGLPEGAREQLFLPSFTRRPGGTGLGLAIVHRIVTDHGGRIRAEDNPGGGTRFVIELPAAAVVAADEETSP